MIALVYLCRCSTGFENGSCKVGCAWQVDIHYIEKEAAKAWDELTKIRLFCNLIKKES